MRKNTIVLVAVASAVSIFSSCTGRQELHPPKEKIFRVASRSKIPTLDPHNTTDVYSMAVQGMVLENLYEYHYLKKPWELIPLLGDGLPVSSKDFKTFTFKVKKGIKFQDHPCFKATGGKGREVVAQDFIDAIYRISNPKKVSPNFSFFEDGVVGINDYHAGKAPTITGVKLIDTYTFEIKLTRPLPRFGYNFSDTRTSPVPKECVESLGDDLANNLVGTGAFRLVEFNPNSKAVLVRNPNYAHMKYPSDGMPGQKEKGLLDYAGQNLPFLDKVEIDVLTEDQPRALKFLAGEHDLLRIPKDYISRAITPDGKLTPEFAAKKINLAHELQGDVTVWIFNLETPVWGHKKELRQAFSLALDRPKLIEMIYANQAIPAQSTIDPETYGFDPTFKSKYGTRDVGKGEEVLGKAGFPDGKGLPVLEMPASADATSRQLAELTQRQLAEVGIQLKVNPMTWPELSKGLREKKWMVTGMAYAKSSPDVDDSLPKYYSKYGAPGPNVANYKNPEVDKLVDDIGSMQNGPARLKKVRQLLDIVDEDKPYVYGVHRIGNHLTHSWVKNYVYTDEGMIGPMMKYIMVEPAK